MLQDVRKAVSSEGTETEIRVKRGVCMENLKVALLQILPTGSLEGNLQKGLEYCRKAKEMGADIALFPEMWSVGYQIAKNISELKASAIEENDPFLQSFAEAAKDLGMAVGVTFLEKFEPLPRNSFCLFDRFGTRKLLYAKVHTCDFGEECRLTPGDDFYVTKLDTGHGMVKIGAMICYDREFPESARILMLKGAEIVLVPNACPMEINRLSQLRARAYENMMGIATANYPSGQPDCNGHSSAFDGIAYRPSEPVSRDMLVVEAGEREDIYLADFPVDELRDYRQREVHGNAYRRPNKYHLLVSETVEEPFLRTDARR
jgi:predicted amidohydrolase